MAKFKGGYIVAGSGVMGWAGTETDYAVARSPMGPYGPVRRMSEARTWASQITSFVPLSESGALLAMCDSWWIPDKRDLNRSRYLWVPVHFDPADQTARMEFQKAWPPFGST